MESYQYISKIHDDASNDRLSRSSRGASSKTECWSHQNIQTYQWGKIFFYSYSTAHAHTHIYTYVNEILYKYHSVSYPYSSILFSFSSPSFCMTMMMMTMMYKCTYPWCAQKNPEKERRKVYTKQKMIKTMISLFFSYARFLSLSLSLSTYKCEYSMMVMVECVVFQVIRIYIYWRREKTPREWKW